MRLLLFLLASSLSAGALAQGIFDDNEARRRIDRLRQEVEAHRQATEARIAKEEQSAQDDDPDYDFFAALDAARTSNRKLFPAELKGISW